MRRAAKPCGVPATCRPHPERSVHRPPPWGASPSSRSHREGDGAWISQSDTASQEQTREEQLEELPDAHIPRPREHSAAEAAEESRFSGVSNCGEDEAIRQEAPGIQPCQESRGKAAMWHSRKVGKSQRLRACKNDATSSPSSAPWPERRSLRTPWKCVKLAPGLGPRVAMGSPSYNGEGLGRIPGRTSERIHGLRF